MEERRSEPLGEHKAALAREVLDDIELSRLPLPGLLLKVVRLARLMEDRDMRGWLNRELSGYENSAEARKFMDWSWRWINRSIDTGHWEPLSAMVARIRALEERLRLMRIPDINYAPQSANPSEHVTGFGLRNPTKETIDGILNQHGVIGDELETLEGICARVTARCHNFATRSFYELAYRNQADSLFAGYQREVDELLHAHVQEVTEKLPSIQERLAAGDSEAVSHAMSSCRRVLKAFADRVYPAADGVVERDGHTYKVGSDEVLNRVALFVKANVASSTRGKRLTENLRRVWERASAGTHDDVTADEARALFLQTYMTVGEIIVAAKAGGWVPTKEAEPDDKGAQGESPPQ